MNYYQYNAEDFAADDDFKEWVSQPTPRSEAFWRGFLADYPERYYQVEEGRRLVEGLRQLPGPPVSERQISGVWTRIEGTLSTMERQAPSRWLIRRQRWQLAASVALLLALGWLVRSYLPETPTPLAASQPAPQQQWIEATNEADQTMPLQLPDGSRIDLGRNSRLKYPKEFTGSLREVYLTGDAFFDIEKNPQKPFMVYTNGLITKVLGTSFHVSAPLYAPSVTVSVRSGRVSVYADKDTPSQDPEAAGVVLTPNQRAVFQRKEAIITKGVVDKPIFLIPESEKRLFAFEEAPAQEVFAALEKAYGLEVVFDEEVLKKCSLTVNLTEEDLYQKLEVICKVLGAQ
ncbi:MAG: FecR family protein, partial [Bacteroidetes bacterium]|nr:FecR family protein [Bacteroidota bacterium]